MRVTIEYMSGEIREYNAETFTATAPFSEDAAGPNVNTEFALRLDRLAEDGLLMEMYWYNGVVDAHAGVREIPGTGRVMYEAGREPGRAVRLASAEEARGISRVLVDGRCAAMRAGDDFVDMALYEAREEACYSGRKDAVSLNARALAVFSYLRAADPTATDDEVAADMGWTMRALRRAITAERAQEGMEGEGGGIEEARAGLSGALGRTCEEVPRDA